MTTDDERDDKVSARYRELGGGAPPARLDDAILAASRRAVQARPGSPGTSSVRRWAVPFSVAAAVILSVMVTVHVQEERPDMVSTAPGPAPAPRVVAPAEKQDAPPPAMEKPAPSAPAASEARKAAVRSAPAPVIAPGVTPGSLGASADMAKAPAPQADAPRSATREEARPQPRFAEEPRPAATGPAPAAPAAAPAAPAAAPAPPPAAKATLPAAAPAKPRPLADLNVAGSSATAPAEVRQRGELARDRMSAEDTVAKRAIVQESPERQLERIAMLRGEGRHAEADKLLAEFRQRYPAYRIADEMLKRVEPPR